MSSTQKPLSIPAKTKCFDGVNHNISYKDLNNGIQLEIRDFIEREIKRQITIIKDGLIVDLIKTMEEENKALADSLANEIPTTLPENVEVIKPEVKPFEVVTLGRQTAIDIPDDMPEIDRINHNILSVPNIEIPKEDGTHFKNVVNL